MNSEILDQYGLQVRKTESYGQFEGFRYRNILYTIVPSGNLEQEEIAELKALSDYMIQRGESTIALIVPTKDGKLSTIVNDQSVILLRFPRNINTRTTGIGNELALFHQKGRTFPYPITKNKRIGQWKGLWEKRLDQMEIFWKDRVNQHPINDFEKSFVESFPYYLGLTENAIQYLVDTEIDDFAMPVDSATICHHRFTQTLWQNSDFVKLPTTWVFDHGSRDLAEYIRDAFINSNKIELNKYHDFLSEYVTTSPLSPFSWRLLYSRLLFPLHYFECIEGYYLTNSEVQKTTYENQLHRILRESSYYEKFLVSIHDLFSKHYRITSAPAVNWLNERTIKH